MHNVRTSLLTVLLIIGLSFAENRHSSALTDPKIWLKHNITSTSSSSRNPKIMYGFPTREGEFGWQASLELLHPSLGFIGHWCGGVLIHKYWVLSSAHCIHNDLFNLPLPALWTVVLGENNRKIESGFEQRIPVDKIIMHEKYRHFKNDLALLKLSRGANLLPKSIVRTIFLPSSSHVHVNPNNLVVPSSHHPSMTENIDDDKFDRNENYLRKIGTKVQNIVSLISQVNEKEVKKRQASNKTLIRPNDLLKATTNKRHRRRNDKFLHRRKPSIADYLIFRDVETSSSSSSTVDYTDCVAVGWGKFQNSGDLSDTLLKIEVPIQNIKRCKEVYSDYVSLEENQHLCAGNMNGKGGTCVGDSGGGLQCKIDRNGPWILVGITSFGSGCAKHGYPDVFTNVAHYRKWIDSTIRNN